MMLPYVIEPPRNTTVPILVSVPHCGSKFPDDLLPEFKSHLSDFPDDTDWFVNTLYSFAPAMGMTMIHAIYSRWVIDLNRDPYNKPLYNDGRIITGLCPTTTFEGEPLYNDERKEVENDEVSRRLRLYYHPYHLKLQELLSDLKEKFGRVLLWDCHSIRQYVPTIHAQKIPDIILGNADGRSASEPIITVTWENLQSGDYEVSHNFPFKGGFITWQYGRPHEDQHALQLEMTKVNYMDDSETKYHPERASKMQVVLKRNFEKLIDHLSVQR